MAGQREILSGLERVFHFIIFSADTTKILTKDDKTGVLGFAGIKLEDVRGIRAPFLAIGGNHFFLNLIQRLIRRQLIISDDKNQEIQCFRCCTRPTSRTTRRCRSTRTNHPPSPTPWTSSWPMTAWSPLAPTGRWQCADACDAYDLNQGLPRGVGGSVGDVERLEGGSLQYGRRLQQPKHCWGDNTTLSFSVCVL